jgi:hypothetical protein
MHSPCRVDADQEDESELAYLDLVSATESLIIDADAIDIRPIQAPHVADAPPLRTASELSMATAHGDVVEKHI